MVCKRRLRLLFGFLALAACLVGGLPQLAAQTDQLKPVVVVSFSGVERLWEDADFLGNLGGVSNLADNLKQTLAAQTGGIQGVPGVDSKRPIGLVVQTDGADFIVGGYLPVADLQKLMDWLKTRDINAEQQGTAYRVDLPNGQSIFLEQKGQWAVISAAEEGLSRATANPPKELDQLASVYDLAISAYVSNVPPMWKQLGIAMIQQGIQTAMEQQPNQSEEEFAAQKAMVQRSFQQLQENVNELDRMMIGVNIDPTANVVTLDMESTVLPGTEAAKEVTLNKNLKTQLAGFIMKDATIVLRETAKTGPRGVAQFKDMMSQYEDMINSSLEKDTKMKKREKELVKNLFSTMLNSIAETVEKEQLDLALSMKLDQKSCEFLMAMTLLGANEMEKTVVDILQRAAKDDADFAKLLKLNAETYKGVRLHVIDFPTDAMEDAPQALKDILGTKPAAVIGFGDKLVCVAFGPDAISALKKALDQSGNDAPVEKILEFYLAVKPLIQFVQVVASEEWSEEDRQFAEQLLAASGAKDRVTMEGTLIENGSRVHMELQEGVLKVLAKVIMKAAEAGKQGAAFGAGSMAP